MLFLPISPFADRPCDADERRMQLIGMLDSPYVRRVAIALIVARTPFRHRPISLLRHIDQFSKLNPLLKAPTLVADDGTALMDSSVILEYLASLDPRIAALTPSDAPARLRASRATGLALTVMEKAVQRHYERILRPAEKRHEPWVDRVMGQLKAGLERPRRRTARVRLDQWRTGPGGYFGRLRLRLYRRHSGRSGRYRAAIPISLRSPPAPRRFRLFAPRRRRMGRRPPRSAIDETGLAARATAASDARGSHG